MKTCVLCNKRSIFKPGLCFNHYMKYLWNLSILNEVYKLFHVDIRESLGLK